MAISLNPFETLDWWETVSPLGQLRIVGSEHLLLRHRSQVSETLYRALLLVVATGLSSKEPGKLYVAKFSAQVQREHTVIGEWQQPKPTLTTASWHVAAFRLQLGWIFCLFLAKGSLFSDTQWKEYQRHYKRIWSRLSTILSFFNKRTSDGKNVSLIWATGKILEKNFWFN